MRQVENKLNRKVWPQENRERWRSKGYGLINFLSRIEAKNPISAEIEEKISSMHSGNRSLTK